MRKLATLLLSLLLHLNANATAQEAMVLTINGEAWGIMGHPLACMPVYKDIISILPSERSTSTSNWDGYRSYWNLKNNKLQLDSIQVQIYNKQNCEYIPITYTTKQLLQILKQKGCKNIIDTKLVTDTIRIVKGKCIKYIHSGYARSHEVEKLLIVKQGKVISSTTFHNSIMPGLDENETITKLREMIDWSKFPELKDYQKRILLLFRAGQYDNEGNLLDISIDMKGNSNAITDSATKNQFIAEVKKILLSISPIKTYKINGLYELCLENYLIPRTTKK